MSEKILEWDKKNQTNELIIMTHILVVQQVGLTFWMLFDIDIAWLFTRT